ncbi:MAG: phosphoglycerate mutase family protein [Chryseolinea sp.]
MKKLILLTLLLGFHVNWVVAQSTITTFILIRHAEKVLDSSEDPVLLPKGEERAKKLVSVLEKTKVDAIYSTKFNRTMSTVSPLASSKGLDVRVYEPFKETPIDEILKQHPGGTVVISGHSNSIPWIANLLVGKKEFADFSDDDYGNILIVDVIAKGKVAKVTWLRY